MYVKQISVYLENVKGSLRELVELLGNNGVNLLALSVADTAGFGIIRLIVKSTELEKAQSVLREGGCVARVNDVICVRIPHKPLGLARVLQALEDKDISVEYSYSFCRSTLDDAVLILRPSDGDAALAALSSANVTLVEQTQVDEF